MVDKSDKLVQLMRRVRPSWTPPPPLADASLLEQGMLCVLSRKLTATQAQATVKALRHAYPDWNVLRVSQIREFREHVKSKSDETALAAARELKNYLQEIYQKNHGFDIEWLREDEANAGKFVLELEVLGGAAGHHLLYLANLDMLPVTQGIIRVLDRVGAMNRTTSLRKARAALQPFVPQNRTSDFAVCFGEVVDRWCDSRRPRCWECPLVEVCTFGKRVFRAWKNQQKRLAVQR